MTALDTHRPLRTGDGRAARVVYVGTHPIYPLGVVIGVGRDESPVLAYTMDGRAMAGTSSPLDLGYFDTVPDSHDIDRSREIGRLSRANLGSISIRIRF